jgi:hypothetical protein
VDHDARRRAEFPRRETNHMVTLLSRLPAPTSARISKVQESLIRRVSALNRAWRFPDARPLRGFRSAARATQLELRARAAWRDWLALKTIRGVRIYLEPPISARAYCGAGEWKRHSVTQISGRSRAGRRLTLVYGWLRPASRKFADRLCSQPDRPSFFFRIWRRNHSCFS